MPEPEAAPAGEPAVWRQRGGFSVLFEARAADAGRAEIWQARIYHEETGQEIVVDGLGEHWPAWMLDRLHGRGSGDRPAPVPAAVHDVSIEVVGVRLVDRAPRGDGVDVVHVEAELVIRGLAALERGLGAAVLDRSFRPG